VRHRAGPVVVVHIPKTAGTALVAALRGSFAHAERAPNVFSRGADVPAFFRSVHRAGADTLLHGHVTLSEAPLFPRRSRLVTVLREPGARGFSHYHHTSENRIARGKAPHPPYETPRVPDNLQARMLCGLPDPLARPADDELLAAAVANLERFAAVGLTERFPESLLRIERALDLPPLDEARENVRAAPPPEDLDVIRARDRLDVLLYAHALDAFEAAGA
jgi:hypothetical protein